MFEKVLIANRGEIAVRVIRALKEMGIGAVAVYSEADRDARHVREADEAYLLGPAIPAESYLNIEKILAVAAEAGAEAIHPGYGFLAENAPFARAIGETEITWIGPPADAIDAMGSKTRAREIMQKAGVPIVPGATEPSDTVADAAKLAEEIGYPIACKAAGGGGGKGFRVAMTADDLADAFEGAAREGEKFFGDATVYLERYLDDPRHVEVQVLADGHGNVIHLGERDCSIQRRHQKLIEEAPAPHVDDEMRERIGKIATDAALAVDYRGAGTVEGMQVGNDYFFLEMNTRVQVEHCVTEMVTGIDIVREQIRIAAGDPLSITQDEMVMRGHAIECRINAEAAHKKFAPAPGKVGAYVEPSGPGVRVDSGLEAGGEVTPLYDPMVAKLITWDVDRESRHPADDPRPRRVRDRGPDDADPLPRDDPRHRAMGAGRDLPRPARGPGLDQGPAHGRRRRADRRRRRGADRTGVQGRGRRPALSGQGDRRGARRRSLRGQFGEAPTEARAQGRRSGGIRRRRGCAAAGQHLQGRGRRGRRGRGGHAARRHRGDEDGERDHRSQGRQDHLARGRGRRLDQRRRPDRQDRDSGRPASAASAGSAEYPEPWPRTDPPRSSAFRGAGTRATAPICRFHRGRCRCASPGPGASAGATSAPSASG